MAPINKWAPKDAAAFVEHALGDKPSPEALDWVQTNVVGPERRFTLGLVIACAVGFALIILALVAPGVGERLTPVAYVDFVVAFVFFALLFQRRKKLKTLFSSLLDNDADPVAFCDRYLAYISLVKQKSLPVAIYNYGRGLRWMGRRQDVETLVDALVAAPEGQNARSRFFRLQLLAQCAFDCQNHDLTIDYVHQLQEMDPTLSDRTMAPAIAQMIALANLLTLEQRQDYAEAYDTAEGYLNVCIPLQKPLFALHLAFCAPSRKEGLAWISYAREHAGTTWIAKAARAVKQEGSFALGRAE